MSKNFIVEDETSLQAAIQTSEIDVEQLLRDSVSHEILRLSVRLRDIATGGYSPAELDLLTEAFQRKKQYEKSWDACGFWQSCLDALLNSGDIGPNEAILLR